MGRATSRVTLGGTLRPNPVIAKGAGSPVVFLHGPFGQEWPGFLNDLAERHRIYAPANPGAEEPADLEMLDDVHDLVLYYDELFENLDINGPFDLIGHSYGGMVGAEYAATYPGKVRRLVLIDAMGLWRDEFPVEEFITTSPETLAPLLWTDLTNPDVIARITPSEDVSEAQSQMVKQFVSLASVGHFTAPIPERGLHKRLRRVRAASLLLWGQQDGLVPPQYAQEFADRITDSEISIIEGAGHYPYVEKRPEVSRRILEFLA
jgi:pimeloyl-ACP methyl ester carboxylesterase